MEDIFSTFKAAGYAAVGVAIASTITHAIWNNHVVKKIGVCAGVAGALIGLTATVGGLFVCGAFGLGFAVEGGFRDEEEEFLYKCLRYAGEGTLIAVISAIAIVVI